MLRLPLGCVNYFLEYFFGKIFAAATANIFASRKMKVFCGLVSHLNLYQGGHAARNVWPKIGNFIFRIKGFNKAIEIHVFKPMENKNLEYL